VWCERTISLGGVFGKSKRECSSGGIARPGAP
jgi:hypothetical protein